MLTWDEEMNSARLSRNSRRASGSRLAIGSSRISSSGLLATASVRASWARWPPDSFPARCRGSRPRRSIRPRARAASQPGFILAPSLRWSATDRAAYVGMSWATKPTRASCARLPPGRPPRTSIVPVVGASMPTARFSRVVFPAPLEPTSPTACPAGTLSVQSVSAQRCPYRLPSPWACRTDVMVMVRPFSDWPVPNVGSRLGGGQRPPERTRSSPGMNRDRRADDAPGPGRRYVLCVRWTWRATGDGSGLGAAPDVGLAVVSAGLMALVAWGPPGQIGTHIAGPPWLRAVLPLLIGAPLAWRRRAPLLMWTALWAAVTLQALLTLKAPAGLDLMFPLFVGGYSVAAHSRLRRALAGLAIMIPGAVTYILTSHGIRHDLLVIPPHA